MKRRRLRPWIKISLIVILLAIFTFSMYRLIRFYYDLHQSKKLNENLVKEVVNHTFEKTDTSETEMVTKIDFDRLLEINSEVKAWIVYNEEKINYPIVQRSNNVYYLYRAIDHRVNSTGTIFMDYRNISFDDQNVILYGHNMVDGSMFGSLDDIFQDGFFDDLNHQFIEIILPGDISLKYQIFSYYITEKEEYYITPKFSSDTAFLDFLSVIQKRSIQAFDVTFNSDEHILTLSTCEGTGGTTKRKVVHARRVKDSRSS